MFCLATSNDLREKHPIEERRQNNLKLIGIIIDLETRQKFFCTQNLTGANFLPTDFKAMFLISKSIRPTQGLTNSSKMVNKVEFNEVMSGLCKS